MLAPAIALALAVTSPGLEATADGGSRPFHELRDELHRLLEREARARTWDERVEAVLGLAALHGELLGDERFASSETLQRYRRQVAARLARVERQLQAQRARAAREPGSGEREAVERRLSAALASSGLTLGGPSRLVNLDGGASGGGAVADEGQALVELIQRTIRPEFWDVNGGPGTIVYYAPLRVLVVRATSEMHHDVGGALGRP